MSLDISLLQQEYSLATITLTSIALNRSALNSIVAYLGLFLSAFVYVPFGELIMSYFSSTLTHKQNKVGSLSAEQTGLGPKTTVAKRAGVKSDRLGGQVFACKH